jgi:hypothetical protein
MCSRAVSASKVKPVRPITTFFPEFSLEVVLRPISDLPQKLPPGRYSQRLSQLSGSYVPLDFIALLYSEFRDVLFKSHASLKLFKFLDHRPQDSVDESAQFLFCFVRTLSFMLSIPPPDIAELLSHCITIDIYKRPLSVIARSVPAHPLPQISEHVRGTAFTERALLAIRKLAAVQFVNPFHCPALAVVPSLISGKTVVARIELTVGEFICELYGEVSVLEEIDDRSLRPAFTHLWVIGTPLIVDVGPTAENAVYSRIRRSIFFNCEPRLFEVNGKPRIGLFAVGPSILPYLGMRRSDGVAIRKGDELLLPFDVMPVIRRFDSDWRTAKGRKVDVDIELLRPRSSAPMPPSDPGEEGDSERGRHRMSEADSLVSFFADEGELQFILTPGEQEPPRRPDLPTVITRAAVPGLKPPDNRAAEFLPEPPPAPRLREKPAIAQTMQFAIMRQLAGIQPRDPWDIFEDCIGPTQADLHR